MLAASNFIWILFDTLFGVATRSFQIDICCDQWFQVTYPFYSSSIRIIWWIGSNVIPFGFLLFQFSFHVCYFEEKKKTEKKEKEKNEFDKCWKFFDERLTKETHTTHKAKLMNNPILSVKRSKYYFFFFSCLCVRACAISLHTRTQTHTEWATEHWFKMWSDRNCLNVIKIILNPSSSFDP